MSGLANDCITAPDAGVTPMLGQRDPQATIFDGDQLYLEHVGERTLYGFLARHRHELFCDKESSTTPSVGDRAYRRACSGWPCSCNL
jgi:hypothetical protein